FEPTQLQALVLSLRIRSEGEGVVTLASPERFAEVAEGLTEALAMAGANQDIFLTFFRSQSSNFLFASQRRVTSARVFFKDDHLNVVFDELDNPYSSFRDPQTNPLKPGSRTKASEVRGQRLVARDTWEWREGRRDWVRLEATAAAIEAARASMPATTSLGADRGAKSLQYGPAAADAANTAQHGATAAEADTGKMPASPKSKPATGPDQAPVASAVPKAAKPAGESADGSRDAWRRIETRLQALKRLRDEGLISDQDYEDKKDELLEDLP
ncbi:unnamed protein product, partial [Chrysoparadoxa australica]